MEDDVTGNHFNVHLCHVCQSKASFIDAKLCSGCKLISYCGKQHQIAHRASHKDYCEAVKKVCRDLQGADVIDAAVAFYLACKEMKDGTSPSGVLSKADQTKVKICVNDFICDHLGRTPKRYELNMAYFFKHCVVCLSRNVKKELVCLKCFGVAYCSTEHQSLDNHEAVCSDFQKILDMDLFVLNVNFGSPEVHLIRSDQTSNLDLNTLDMKGFIAQYVKPGLKFEEETLISFYFTSVLTFADAISQIPNFKLGKKLTIHIVGAHANCEDLVLAYWENLLHMFPRVQVVTVIHIGPEIRGCPSKLKLCSNCKNAKRSVEVSFHQQCYHEYYQNSHVAEKPDAVIAFNSGLYGPLSGINPWRPSLPFFFKFDSVPIILTERYESELGRDLEALLNPDVICGKNVRVVVKCKENPFKNLRLWRDWTGVKETVYFKSDFVTTLIVESS